MRKCILWTCALLAMPLFAIPPSTDKMIRSLVKEETSLASVLDALMTTTADTPFGSAFESVSIKKVLLTEELRDRCNNRSKSGAVLEVTIQSEGGNSTYFLSTEGGSPLALRRCE